LAAYAIPAISTGRAFIAVVGGFILFGPSGLILGRGAPTITRLLLEIWPLARSTKRCVRKGELLPANKGELLPRIAETQAKLQQ